MRARGILAVTCCALFAGAAAADDIPKVSVDVSAHLSTDHVIGPGSARLWIVVTNTGSEPVTDVRVERIERGGQPLAMEAGCWCHGGAPGCWSSPPGNPPAPAPPPVPAPAPPPPSSAAPSCDVVAPTLGAGQATTVFFDLPFSDPPGQRWWFDAPQLARSSRPESVWTVVSWTHTTVSRRAVDAGTVLYMSRASERWSDFGGLLKDLALPGVVAFGGFWLQWFSKRRAQVAETWSQMLPVSHSYAVEHYSLLVAAAQGAYGAIEKASRAVPLVPPATHARSSDPAFQGFLNFLLLLRRQRILSEKVGGFYFKDRRGEVLASRAFRLAVMTSYIGGLQGANPEVVSDHNRMLDAIDPNERAAGLLEKMAEPKADESGLLKQAVDWVWTGPAAPDDSRAVMFRRSLNAFAAWAKTPEGDQSRRSLKAFAALLRYEMNRPYERWYNRRERIDVDYETRIALRNLVEEDKRWRQRWHLHRYLWVSSVWQWPLWMVRR